MAKKTGVILISLLAILLIVGVWKQETIFNYVQPLRVVHIDLHHLPENRLRFKVSVKANRKSDASLKYWQVGTTDTLYSDVSNGKREHDIFIYNLLANKDYRFQVAVRNSGQEDTSKTYPFVTKPIYQTTPYFNLDSVDVDFASSLKDSYFLTQILSEPGAAVIINGSGDIVWYEPFSKGVKVSTWSQDKTVLCILGSEDIPSSGGDEIVEIGLDGRYIQHFKVGEGDMDKLVHHEVGKDSDGNIFAITFDSKIVDLTSLGGLKNDTVKADGIVVFDKGGKKVWEWSLLDHIDILDFPELMKSKKDLVHANSLSDDGQGFYLMSFRDLNQIWKIDKGTGEVLWKFGENGDFPLAEEDIFSSQHRAHINSVGDLMLLDNGTKVGQSRAISFALNESQRSAEKKIEIQYPRDLYSTVKGNATMYGKDKVLVCLTDPRSFLITDLAGKLLWKLSIGGDPYRIEEVHGFSLSKKQ